MYLEDFMASEEKSQVAAEAGGCSSSSVVTLSTISDAASSSTFVAWQRQVQPSAKVDVPEDYTKLSPKRRKGLIMGDDSLEDTASSPVNSPKVIRPS